MDLDGIFDRFSQLGPPFARSQGRLGIGVALVRTLVDLHGAGVEARRGGPGRGSEFIVRRTAPAGAGSSMGVS